MITGGYILMARQMDKSDAAKFPPVTRELWNYLLRNVNHKNHGKFKRGQNFFTLSDIQESLCWYVGYRKVTYSKPQLTKSLRRLREGSMIATTKATHGIVITICNYDYYQNPKNYEGNSEGNVKETRRKSIGHTKNKNVKNKNKYITPLNPPKGEIGQVILRIVDYLNRKTDSSFKPGSKETIRHIQARIREGYKPDDFKLVIDFKCSQWLNDAEKQEYLRPKTLFCSNFEGYLNAARRHKGQARREFDDRVQTKSEIKKEIAEALS